MLMARRQFDLAMVDYTMPKLDGFTLGVAHADRADRLGRQLYAHGPSSAMAK